MSRLLLTGILALAFLLPATRVDAQSAQTIDKLYGQGVHDYFAGEFQQAMNSFSNAIEMGSRDPRVFYFRGLVQGNMGNEKASMADFVHGAQLEATPSGRYYSVGQALERVQGKMRLKIEQARNQARVAQHQSNKAMVQNASDTDLPVIPDPPAAGQPTNSQLNFPDVSGVENAGTPFDGPMTIDRRPPVERVAVPENAATEQKQDDPFGDSKDDPFGDKKGDVESPEKDPFSDNSADNDAADAKMDDNPPAGNDPPADEDDPFGDGSTKNDADDAKQGDDAKDDKKSPPDDPFGDDG